MRNLVRLQFCLTAAPAIELCLVDLTEAPSQSALQSLSSEELAKAARFVFERDRRRYVAAHCALREVLSERTGVPAAQLVFATGEFDKPYLRDALHCHFNLAHSGDRAAIGISDRGEIGIDLEILRAFPGLHETAGRVFTPTEVVELDHTAEASQALAFFYGWTRKEACLKAIGSGLSIEPDTFEAGLDCTSRVVGVHTGKEVASVTVHSLLVADDWVLSAAEMSPESPLSTHP